MGGNNESSDWNGWNSLWKTLSPAVPHVASGLVGDFSVFNWLRKHQLSSFACSSAHRLFPSPALLQTHGFGQYSIIDILGFHCNLLSQLHRMAAWSFFLGIQSCSALSGIRDILKLWHKSFLPLPFWIFKWLKYQHHMNTAKFCCQSDMKFGFCTALFLSNWHKLKFSGKRNL